VIRVVEFIAAVNQSRRIVEPGGAFRLPSDDLGPGGQP